MLAYGPERHHVGWLQEREDAQEHILGREVICRVLALVGLTRFQAT